MIRKKKGGAPGTTGLEVVEDKGHMECHTSSVLPPFYKSAPPSLSRVGHLLKCDIMGEEVLAGMGSSGK